MEFRIKKKGISFIIDPIFNRWWAAKDEGSLWLIKIEKYIVPTKEVELKNNQRKYYFGHVIKAIFEDTGQNTDDIHNTMKLKFASEEDAETGIIVSTPVFRKESELSLDERWYFIQQVRSWANDFRGIKTDPPDPNWRRMRYGN